jgi:hypothetical protein
MDKREEDMPKRAVLIVFLSIITAGILFLTGCQGVFTSGLFQGLQPDPKTLSNADYYDFGYSLLASGTDAQKTAFYTDLQTRVALPANVNDAHLNYLAALYATEFSGIPKLMALIKTYLAVFNDPLNITPQDKYNAIAAYTNTLFDAAKVTFFTQAATYYTAAETNGIVLNKAEYYISRSATLLAPSATLGAMTLRLQNPALGLGPGPTGGEPAVIAAIELYTSIPTLSNVFLFDVALSMGAQIDLSGL